MPKSILVPIAGGGGDKAHLRAALAIARRSGAHLDIVHVRPDSGQIAAAAASAAYGSPDFIGPLLEQLEKDAQRRFESAKATFEAFVKEENLEQRERPNGLAVVTTACLYDTGYANSRVAALGRLHDLLVVGHAPEETTGTLETALMESGRPVLVMPADRSEVAARTVVVAWKDSAEAARAVTAAMPFLAAAERVVILEIAEEEIDAAAKGQTSGERLAASLAWHGIKAESRVVEPGDRPAPDALLATAHEIAADLLVMGAYGHSRIREMIFGGFTRRILRGADLPVLMFH